MFSSIPYFRISIAPSEGSKGDRKALGRSGRSEIGGKQLHFIIPGFARRILNIRHIRMGFAPSGATNGDSEGISRRLLCNLRRAFPVALGTFGGAKPRFFYKSILNYI